MLYSIVDIGSNTVRLVTYKINGNSYVPVYTDYRALGLISEVENGILSENAIDKLCQTLSVFKENSPKEAIFLAFATAFLRVTKNSEDVKERIMQNTGIKLEILSEEQEAIYSFKGIIRSSSKKSGVAADFGGGSCEFIKFSDSTPEIFKSLPFGCVKLSKMFVKGDEFPTADEMLLIRKHVTKQLDNVRWIHGTSDFVLTGGTGRALAQMGNFINGTSLPLSEYSFSNETFERLYNSFITFDTVYTDFIKKVMPSRITTIYPGLAAIKAISDYIGLPQITISTEGVREGYLTEIIGR